MIENIEKAISEVGESDPDLLPDFAKDVKPEKVKSFEEANKSYSEVRTEILDELGDLYNSELEEYSEYPETIEKTNLNDWDKVSPEEVSSKRLEYKKEKNNLISEWEEKNGQEWPTYDEDLVNENGNVIRRKGDKYDAHHVQPLEYGGENEAGNLTPINAENHYDHKGIHSVDGSYGEIKGKIN